MVAQKFTMSPSSLSSLLLLLRFSFVALLLFVTLSSSSVVAASDNDCVRLTKTILSYPQHEAPTDLSSIIPIVTEHINRELQGVKDVEVNWKGSDFISSSSSDHHHVSVGEHIIQCKVTRSLLSIDDAAQNDDTELNVTQCYHIPFTITDTNECLLPNHHRMKHQCDVHSTICVNTIGSYECICPRLLQQQVDNEKINEDNDPNHIIFGMAIIDPLSFFTILHDLQDRGPWELSYKSTTQSSCPFTPSTYGCCSSSSIMSNSSITSSSSSSSCHAQFHCPIDPCSKKEYNDCSNKATCVRKVTPSRKTITSLTSTNTTTTAIIQGQQQQQYNNNNNIHHRDYTCKCPMGYMGNGYQCNTGFDPIPQPKLKYDGITPTDDTMKYNMYCDCTIPIIDPCDGYTPSCTAKHQECVVDSKTNEPMCACKQGYMYHNEYGCVDEVPPVLQLINDINNDQTLHLYQGDMYTEYAVTIHDDNAEEYLRTLKIAYSQSLPQSKCFIKIGQFHVNYTIATPWTIPPYVRITRYVHIHDIDECTIDYKKYRKICPELIPKCDPMAKCMNTIGSYKCQCPPYTTGDGYQKGLTLSLNNIIPDGYHGGEGCIDNTIPTLHIYGPNPKIFHVADGSMGIVGVMNRNNSTSNKSSSTSLETWKRSQQQHFYQDIKKLIESTDGAELCATYTNSHPDHIDCIRAYDMTANGKIDLSKKVILGELIEKSLFHWLISYHVHDDAGNEALTVYRDIIVEQVNIMNMENKIRNEMMKQYTNDINQMMDDAKFKERQLVLKEMNEQQRQNQEMNEKNLSSSSSSICPVCVSGGDGGASSSSSSSCPVAVNEKTCSKICQKLLQDQVQQHQQTGICTSRTAESTCYYDSTNGTNNSTQQQQSLIIRMILFLERTLYWNILSTIVSTLFICSVILISLLFVRIIFLWIVYLFGRSRYDNNNNHYNMINPIERGRQLRESVGYFNNSNYDNYVTNNDNSNSRGLYNDHSYTQQRQNSPFMNDTRINNSDGNSHYTTNATDPPPPRISMSLGNDNYQPSLFSTITSPSSSMNNNNRMGSESMVSRNSTSSNNNNNNNRGIGLSPSSSLRHQQQQQQQQEYVVIDDDDIYEPSIITPRRTGDAGYHNSNNNSNNSSNGTGSLFFSPSSTASPSFRR